LKILKIKNNSFDDDDDDDDDDDVIKNIVSCHLGNFSKLLTPNRLLVIKNFVCKPFVIEKW